MFSRKKRKKALKNSSYYVMSMKRKKHMLDFSYGSLEAVLWILGWYTNPTEFP